MSFFANQTTGTTMYNPNILNIVDLTNIANPTNTGSATTTSIPDGTMFTTGEGAFSNVSGGDYNLYVYGNVYASNFNSLCPLVFTAGEKPSMWITEEGQVGIGKPNPKAHLHVGGNVLIDEGAVIHGTTLFIDDVVFQGPVQFNRDVYINGKLFINGREIV